MSTSPREGGGASKDHRRDRPSHELLAELQIHQVELEMQNQELRETQASLEDARQRYFQLFDLSPAGFLVIDSDRRIREVNQTAAQLLGAPPAQLRTEFFRKHVPAGERETLGRVLARVLDDGESAREECRLRDTEGRSLTVRIDASPVGADGGRSLGLLALVDVTAEKRATRRLEQVFELAPDPMVVLDLDGTIRMVSPSTERMSGYDTPDLLGTRLPDLIHQQDRTRVELELSRLASGLAGSRFDARFVGRGGECRTLSWSGMPAREDKLLYLTGHDITRRLEDEERLRRSEALLNNAQRIARMGTWEYEVRGRHLRWSGQTHRIFGVSAEGLNHDLRNFLSMVIPEDRDRLGRALQRAREGESTLDVEYRIQRPDGDFRTIFQRGEVYRDETGRPLRLVGMVMDITERRALEDRLLRSQKLESIGRLAGGIAHDFNNFLTVILSSTEVKLRELPKGDPLRNEFQEVHEAAERAARLTAQLLAFGRRQVMRPRTLDLAEVVAETLSMLKRLLGDHIGIETRIDTSQTGVLADRSQLEQVVSNLVLNARDAMPNGGIVEITLDRFVVPGGEDADLDQPSPGTYLRLSIRDEGMGMEEVVRRRIFEPFFTTKQLGQGTGLGLATVYGIVRQNGGHISVESSPGEGTCFTVLLPEAEGEDPSPSA
ncbi:MAG: PAS domain S-box protein [Gemmatimonadales bacterium]|nr:MAG: PAS domain S-box protein [Gemmatimonadales bacterium]